jgi:transposase InsO family protein
VDGRKYKCLTIIDELTKESLKIQVERSIASRHVLGALSKLFLAKGIPKFIRGDNGSKFIAKNVQKFIRDVEVKTAYITPESPWETALSSVLRNFARRTLESRGVLLIEGS